MSSFFKSYVRFRHNGGPTGSQRLSPEERRNFHWHETEGLEGQLFQLAAMEDASVRKAWKAKPLQVPGGQ
jgi:hypothetical protein